MIHHLEGTTSQTMLQQHVPGHFQGQHAIPFPHSTIAGAFEPETLHHV